MQYSNYFGINIGLGPYVAYGIAGNITIEVDGPPLLSIPTTEEPIKFGNDANEDDLRPFDYGVNFGAGVEFSKFFINLQYGLGLANLTPEGDSDNTSKNSVFGFSVGYYFLGGK